MFARVASRPDGAMIVKTSPAKNVAPALAYTPTEELGEKVTVANCTPFCCIEKTTVPVESVPQAAVLGTILAANLTDRSKASRSNV